MSDIKKAFVILLGCMYQVTVNYSHKARCYVLGCTN